QDRASKLDGLKVVVIRQASEVGQLYGSVGARDIADAAKDAGHTVERAQVQIDTPIKMLGLFPVKVKLHPEVTILVTVNVARSPEEAVVKAEKGSAAAKKSAEKAEVEAAFGAPVSEAEGEEEAPAKKPAKKAKKAADAEAEEAEAEDKPKAKKAK